MSDLPEPMPPGQLRASNADRERVAAVLQQAAADGRLDLDELHERLGRAYAARTYAELETLTRDLAGAGPGRSPAVHPPATQPPDPAAPASGRAIAVMSGFERKGRWTVPRRLTAFAFWGGGSIDLREAYYSHGAVKIRAIAIMGGVEIIVPEDAPLQAKGLAIMGGFDHQGSGAGAPGVPPVEIGGFAFWGGVSVKRRASGEEEKRRRLERERLRAERRALDE